MWWTARYTIDGSAPNLVTVVYDEDGNPHYQRVFNTQVSENQMDSTSLLTQNVQACEQLNAWIGGFQPILNKMTVYNFDWTLHAMLFLHTQRILLKLDDKYHRENDDPMDVDEEEEDNDEEEDEEDNFSEEFTSDDDDGIEIDREEQIDMQ